MKGIGGRPDPRAATNPFEAGPPQRASHAQASGSSSQPVADEVSLKRRRIPSDDPVQAATRRARLPAVQGAAEAAPLPSGALKLGGTEGPSAGNRRHMVTAQDIVNLLTMQKDGVSRREIGERLKIGLSSVDDWVREPNWRSGMLPKRLSKLPDYPAMRERIQNLVQAMGLYAAELPPPAATTRNAITASQLADALQMLIDRDKHAPVKGRFMEHVAKTVGVSAGSLRGWITGEGKLLRPPGSVRNLPGFDQHANRLSEGLSRLGQTDAAHALETDAADPRKETTTESLVAVLGDMLKEPGKPLMDMALARNLAFGTLRRFIAPNASLRIDPDKLAELPDYGQHVDALRSVLTALGHTEQAEGLKPATMAAADFLDVTRQHFGRLMAMVDRLAIHPDADRVDETRRSGIPPQLLAVLFDPAGALRSEADIHQRLTGIEPHQRASLKDMLARIAKRHASGAAAVAEQGMKRIDMLHGGTIPDRALLVGQASVDPGPGAPQRLERIYADSPGLVREPRSYAPDRQRQVLRWLSTVLKQKFPESMEVQSYFDAERNRIVVSANSSQGNKNIRRFLRDGGLTRLLDSTPASLTDMTARELRHLTKLSRRMDPTPPAGSEAAKAVFAAITECRFEVPKRAYTSQGAGIRLHAERRIKDHVAQQGVALDPAQLAGTMRPCGTCASELELPPQAHRGPFWQSAPARYGVDIEDLIRQDQRDGTGTSITRTREAVLTFDVDTDSDSDAELPHPNLTVFTTPR